MIREIEIEGFKSIDRLKLELGRVTVLIGENGCGKSNVLEAIAFASAAQSKRLDHEFLASRGVRSTEPRFMRPAFSGSSQAQMRVRVLPQERLLASVFVFTEDTSATTPAWAVGASLEALDGEVNVQIPDIDSFIKEVSEEIIKELLDKPSLRTAMKGSDEAASSAFQLQVEKGVRDGLRESMWSKESGLDRFLVFSPENTALRTFEREGQILPIGINGEGLFAHLRAIDRAGKTEVLEELNRRLSLIDWFSGFELPTDLGPGERRLSLRDRYLASDALLDQRSANEGFLFLLFYYTLLLSPDTPKFFAIDNIDASLNPRLCARLMRDVVELAKHQDRQVVVTTHNPAVLDGLDLTDEEQRLVVVSRTEHGATRVRRVPAPKPIEGAPALRLSEAFLRGYLGGLPDNF